VRTQTQISRSVIIQNTPLSATFTTLLGASNTDVSATLQFAVTASTNAISRIELFTTGGSVGAVTNQSSALFSVPGVNLGLGLHSFYAVVTPTTGAPYRTQTQWIRLIGPEPAFALTMSAPATLTWPATAGRSYDVLGAATPAGLQVQTSVIPTNSPAQWTDTNAPASSRFYRVRTSQ
jgi:hypothetical protein